MFNCIIGSIWFIYLLIYSDQDKSQCKKAHHWSRTTSYSSNLKSRWNVCIIYRLFKYIILIFKCKVIFYSNIHVGHLRVPLSDPEIKNSKSHRNHWTDYYFLFIYLNNWIFGSTECNYIAYLGNSIRWRVKRKTKIIAVYLFLHFKTIHFFYYFVLKVFVVLILTWSAIATAIWCVTNRTALSFWDYYLSTVRHFITLHLIAQDGPAVTNADPAWFRFPDVSVCVHLPVFCTAQFILYKQKR